MKSSDYRRDISRMIRNGIRKQFPGLKNKVLETASVEIAKAIHAKFYGADVDGVGSPIWRDDPRVPECNRGQPTKTANEILNEEMTE